MGTAFSSSLLGLSGSLILGFLELQASHAHNRFYNELEEWLSGITELTPGGRSVSSDHVNRQLSSAILRHAAGGRGSFDSLGEDQSIAGAIAAPTAIDEQIRDLARGVNQLVTQMRCRAEGRARMGR